MFEAGKSQILSNNTIGIGIFFQKSAQNPDS
jgi:hypothetical protein